MNNPLHVSILVPFYNVETYFSKCLNTIFCQTYRQLEYIFIDDGSTDNSLSILKQCINDCCIDSTQIQIIRHERNLGIAITRSECIQHAKGDYILFVDGDDWIDIETVEMMVDATKSGSIDIVGCDYMDEFESGRSVYHYESYASGCRENMIKCLNYDVSPVLWKILVRKCLFDKFEITPNLNIGEDYVISVKLYYYADSFVALHKAYYHYVHYNLSKLSYQRIRSLKDHIKVVEEVERFLSEKGLLKDNYVCQLNLRKFNIKSNFLTKQTLDYTLYKETFPELNGLWRYFNYSLSEKIKFWLAEKNLYLILRFIQKYIY